MIEGNIPNVLPSLLRQRYGELETFDRGLELGRRMGAVPAIFLAAALENDEVEGGLSVEVDHEGMVGREGDGLAPDLPDPQSPASTWV